MTVFDASVMLFGWFSENDSFSIDMVDRLVGKPEASKSDVSAIQCGLERLQKMGMISESTVDLDRVWVLEKSFKTQEQQVKISAETCNTIARVVNAFCEVINNEADKCDPLEISEADIQNLLFLTNQLIAEKGGEEN